ncbi:MAG: ABC transporter ATP-binding protein [Planctomycetota bacterium]|nr:ABC transporter ATP-binding protein [Planctomycetota bacterium]
MLKIDSLSFQYGRRSALKELTASSNAGKVVALVGRNGSGKSTLLRVIAGLAHPSLGSVLWRGEHLARMAPSRRALEVSYVSQRPTLSIDLTVQEMIALGRFAARTRLDSILRIDQAIELMGLDGLKERSFHEISAGEQQRCVIARALAQHESNGLLALDEPFSNLDPGETMRVFGALKQRAQAGALVVVAMHDLSLVDRVAETVWWLEQGKLVAAGAPADVLTPAKLQEVFHCEFIRGPQGLTLTSRV